MASKTSVKTTCAQQWYIRCILVIVADVALPALLVLSPGTSSTRTMTSSTSWVIMDVVFMSCCRLAQSDNVACVGPTSSDW
eukprot:6457522-Amphidinium_carterae.3